MGRREHKELCVWILPDSACVFSPDDPAVYPYYAAVINLSCEYKDVLSPLSPSSEYTNVRVVLFCSNLSSFITLANICWAPTYARHRSKYLEYVPEGRNANPGELAF